MGLERVTYVQVFCDYPDHGAVKILAEGSGFHQLVTDNKHPDMIVCNMCWDNRMTVEDLLKLVKISSFDQTVKPQYGAHVESVNAVNDAEKTILARLATEDAVQTAPIVDFMLQDLAVRLEAIRQTICPYTSSSTICDCKYGIGYGTNVRVSEKTGCPELREIITIYRGAARGFPKN